MQKTVSIVLFSLVLLAVVGRAAFYIADNLHNRTESVDAKAAVACTATAQFECAAEPLPCSVEMYNMYDDRYAVLYEKYFSKRQIVTNMSERRLQRLQDAYGCSRNKLKSILLVQDLLTRRGNAYSLSALNAMSDRELVRLALPEFKAEISAMSEEDRLALENDFKAITAN